MHELVEQNARPKASEESVIEMDSFRITCDQDGVKPYYWPIRREEIVDAGSLIIQTITRVLGKGVLSGDKYAEGLVAVSVHFLREALSVFQANLLSERCRKDHKRLGLPASNHLWRSVFEGKEPQQSGFLQSLANGVYRPPFFKRALRPLRAFQERDGFTRRSIEFIDFDHDIVCVTNCPLTTAHVEQESARVVLCPLNEWFYPPATHECVTLFNKNVALELALQLLEELNMGFAERGGKLPPYLVSYLVNWLSEAYAWIDFYRERLRRNSDRLPKTLWAGSSGIIWSRLLAHAVRCKGGTVVSHDHVLGASYSEISPVPFTEFQSCDVFVTFSKAQADLYEQNCRKYLITGHMPQLHYLTDSLKEFAGKRMQKPALRSTKIQSKRILYVTPYFPTDIVGPAPLMPSIVAVDWQARLFCKLKEQGILIYQKPHPQCPTNPPEVFGTQFGVEELSGLFENVYDCADVLVFDWPLTTTFGFALQTDMPIVFIDFGFNRLPDEDQLLFERRCAVIRGWYDSENRAQIRFDKLSEAIDASFMKKDMAFVQKVMGTRSC